MINRDIFFKMGGWWQLLYFLLITFAGFILAAMVILLASVYWMKTLGVTDIMQSISYLKIMQFVQAGCLFFIPSILFAYLFHNKPKTFLKIDRLQSFQFILLVILLIIVIQPFIYMVSYYNQQLVLPDFLSGLEHWMQVQEANSERIIGLFVADKSFSGVITNLFIMAIVAGIVEEFFFRGSMQQIINKIVCNNKHLAVWLTAIIFSTIHFQFYGFVPRLLLGALLGYLFIWSGSLWVPIIAHALHNAINIILMQMYYDTSYYNEIENLIVEKYIWVGVLSLIFSFLLIFSIKRKRIPELEV